MRIPLLKASNEEACRLFCVARRLRRTKHADERSNVEAVCSVGSCNWHQWVQLHQRQLQHLRHLRCSFLNASPFSQATTRARKFASDSLACGCSTKLFPARRFHPVHPFQNLRGRVLDAPTINGGSRNERKEMHIQISIHLQLRLHPEVDLFWSTRFHHSQSFSCASYKNSRSFLVFLVFCHSLKILISSLVITFAGTRFGPRDSL